MRIVLTTMKCVRCLLISLLVMLAALAAACGDDSESGGGVTVVATTTQAADLVRQVGGDRVNVEGMLRPGGDPHDYEPRPSDVAAVADATVVFRSGGEVDDWLTDVIDNAGGDAEVVSLIDSVKRLDDDPHWWQDATQRSARRGGDPRGAHEGRPGRPGHLRAQRRANHARGSRASTARSPPASSACRAAKRKIVTTHDALGYFARRYGVEVVGCRDPLALDAGAGVRRGRAAARRADPPRGRGGHLPGELREPGHRARDRARGRARASAIRSTRTRSARREARGRPTPARSPRTRRRSCAACPPGA